MAAINGTTTAATMKESFPSMPPVTDSTPTLKSLLACLQHIINCAQSFRITGQPLGLLNIAIPAPAYVLYTADAYPARTNSPGERPFYAPNAGSIARLNTENLFAIAYRQHHDERTMDSLLIDRLYAMLGIERAQDLRDAVVALADPTFLQVYDQAVALWGIATPFSRDENRKSLKADWHEIDGMAKLWRQIKTAVSYAVYARQPIPPEQIVDAALICINRTQAYKQDYLAWKRLPVQNYAALKVHFEQAERDRREVEDEASAHGYGMNATDAADRDMQRSLTDLAAALTSAESANGAAVANNNSSLNQQAQLMAASLQSLQNGMAQMQQQMANLAMPPAAPPPVNAFQQMPFAQMPFCAPAMQQPAQQQYNNNNNRGAPQNPVKRYENQNYCWSHGGDISAKHHSGNCPKQLMGHQCGATRQNPMGGTPKGCHKTIMPSAAGKVCQDMRDQQRNQKRQQNRGNNGNSNGHSNFRNNGYQQQQGNGYQQQRTFSGNNIGNNGNFGYQPQQQQQQNNSQQQQQQFGGFAMTPPMNFPQQQFMGQQQQNWGSNGYNM